MLQSLSAEIHCCYEHAEQCARRAKNVTDNKLRADYLRLEQGWLKLARSYELGRRLELFTNESDRRREELDHVTSSAKSTSTHHFDEIEKTIRANPGPKATQIAKVMYGPTGYGEQVHMGCLALLRAGQIERRGRGGSADPFTYYPAGGS
jgi:hypothetical protein